MSLHDAFLIISKTIFCYFFLFGVLKIMGKREVGEISTFDMVVFLVMSELFSLSLNNAETSLWHSIIPIVIIMILQLITAFLSLKFKKVRMAMEGKPTYLILQGIIQQKELKKNRYNLDDLMMQLRSKDVQSPFEVAYAILEGNGTLSIVKKKDQQIAFPEPIIEDGKINMSALKSLGKEKEEVYFALANQGFQKPEEVYFGELLVNGQFRFLAMEGLHDVDTVQQNIKKAGDKSGKSNGKDMKFSHQKEK